jgi:hypothetical protein
MHSTLWGAAAVSLLCLLAPSAKAELRCEINAKQVCNPDGCRSVAPTVHNKLDGQHGLYSRCDANGCDDYPASITRSGAFANVEVPGRGVIAKVSLADGAFLEVATLGLEAYVSYGACKPAPL